mmetsp:Transcript_31539/g.86887  ORF Transcript_31539/g.86887 Transcript_31539/m.86887 type:complete len:582 (-) Transcript_31539:87-1832(-)
MLARTALNRMTNVFRIHVVTRSMWWLLLCLCSLLSARELAKWIFKAIGATSGARPAPRAVRGIDSPAARSLAASTANNTPWQTPRNLALQGSVPAHVLRLRRQIFKNVEFPALLALPSCAKNARVYVYDIADRFHVGAIGAVEKMRKSSPCGWQTSDCFEARWDNGYSDVRSIMATEVLLLYKFLSMPIITDDPLRADLFVVPLLGATFNLAMGNKFKPGTPKTRQILRSMLGSLAFFQDPAKRRRHVFLATHDRCNVDTLLLHSAKDSFVFHSGPRGRRGELVAVSGGARFGGHGRPLVENPAHSVFYMAGGTEFPKPPLFKEMRWLMGQELQRLERAHPELNVMLPKMAGRSIALAPGHIQYLMQNSLLCPIPEGDYTHSHRLFDAIFSGCVPVFVNFTFPPYKLNCAKHPQPHCAADAECVRRCWMQQQIVEESDACKEWWSFSKTYYPKGCRKNALPFPSTLDWTSISMQVRSSDFRAGRFAEALRDMLKTGMPEIRLKRKRLDRVRQMFTYDWKGRSYDAFSGVLEEMCGALDGGPLAPPGWEAYPVLPIKGSESLDNATEHQWDVRPMFWCIFNR